jgi:predicted Zn-dependent protease
LAARRPDRILTRRAALLLILALGLAPGCAGENGKFDPLGAIGSLGEVSEDDERSLGAQVDAAIRAQVPMIDDPVVLGFVNELGQRIVAQIEPQPFIYRFRVIPNSTLNAFALPSGYVYFHSATILQAGSLNELAGVMGHEIAHVKGRHYARGSEATFWPSLLARVAGIGAAVASGEPGFAAAAEGVNVALQLSYSRQFEAEADEMGSVFMARAGFDPIGMGRFFERIVAADVPSAIQIPPYLYSHPDVDKRISAVEARAATLRITGRYEPQLEARFREAQVRLAKLIALGRTSFQGGPPYDRARTDPLLAQADAAAKAGRPDDALAVLDRAERTEPNDPRVSFKAGEILKAEGRTREAVFAWRRTVALDSSVALAYYHLGDAYKQLGNRHDAAYWYEQAERRFKQGGAYQQRAHLAIQTLEYPPVTAAGLAAAEDGVGASATRDAFARADAEAIWWAKLDKRYALLRRRVKVRFTDPSGAVAQESTAEKLPGGHVGARLPLAGRAAGAWQVEAVLDGQVIDRRSFALAGS